MSTNHWYLKSDMYFLKIDKITQKGFIFQKGRSIHGDRHAYFLDFYISFWE